MKEFIAFCIGSAVGAILVTAKGRNDKLKEELEFARKQVRDHEKVARNE